MKQVNSTTANIPAALTEPLLAWYRENARDLPWRHTEDPYRIWVSEIMLQQTRVAAVLGYYARFLEAFPTVETLASADEERLMKLWEGLGYYSRARNLQKAAKEVVAMGGFPDTYAGLLALPGIGDYTASAIAAAAFGRREPAVDGNVLRVAARLTDCHGDILDPKTKGAVRAGLAAVMPENTADIRIFNQAMMELGATVCGPNTAPRCGECPVQALCLGHRLGTAEALPVKKAKKERRVEEKTVFLLLKEGKIALRKRPKTGLLAGLWEFPQCRGHAGRSVRRGGGGSHGIDGHQLAEPPDGETHLHPCGVAHDRLRPDGPGRRTGGPGLGGCVRAGRAVRAVGLCPVL